MKKLLLMILCMAMLFSCAACSGGSDIPDDVTVIRVDNFTGGIGVQWLRDAAARFTEENQNTSFEPGKTGVYIDISTVTPEPSTISTSGYHIFFDERFSNIYELAQTGKLVSLKDLITEKDENGDSLESKIYPSVLEGLKGSDGNYYALPHYEWFPGLMYDREAFDNYGWYFAKDAENGNLYNSKYGAAYFVKDAESDKSCGPNGIYGDDDDGLPTSLQELIILCSRINERVKPILLTGAYPYYANYLVEGLWASLAGQEEMRALYDMTGTVEVVTRYTNENLFTGIDYVKKPIVESVEVTPETGYLAYESAAQYYAQAFVEVITKEGWFAAEATQPNMSQVETQKTFIYGGLNSQTPYRAMMIEGSYWYNESLAAGNFSEYFALAQGKTMRDIRFMPLPTTLNTTITEGNGEDEGKVSLIDNGIAYAYINARFADDENIIRACKEFLKFLYSDEELRAFTASTGITRPIDYNLSEGEYAGLSDYQQSVYDLARDANILYFSSANNVFKRNQGALKVQPGSDFLKPTLNGAQYQSSYIAYRDGNYGVQDIFDKDLFKNEWAGMLAS